MTASRPEASSAEVGRRMRAVRQRGTAAEMALRKALRAWGLRYRVNCAVIPGLRRKADIAFVQEKLAVFVDGCFWHCCPKHGTQPKANAEWWKAKLAGNKHRDRDTNRKLASCGWRVVRVWEHEIAERAAARIVRLMRAAPKI